LKKANDLDSDSDEASEPEEMENFEKFLASKNQAFMQKMSEYVNLRKIINFLEEMGHVMQYKEFKKTFEDKVRTESYLENILIGAMDVILKDYTQDVKTVHELQSKGVVSVKGKCDYCQGTINNRWDRQEIWFLACGHIYHARCIAKTDGKCTLCFNELEAFQSIHKS